MREVWLDGATMNSRDAAHDALQAALELPGYYGRNLDALYDCLTERGLPTHITLVGADALRQNLGDYGALLLQVLADAVAQNPALSLALEE